MIVTTSWMETWFAKFNAEYFGKGLPMPMLKLSKARTQLGQMSCKRVTRWGRTKLYDFTIKMTTYYDMTERQAQNVLLHEMIHYSIAYTGLRDTAPHGIIFRGMADKLNRDHGWEIRVMTTTRGWKKAVSATARTPEKPSRYLVLALEMANGDHFLSVVHPNYALKIDRQLGRMAQVARYAWYFSTDSYFENMPQVRSLRGKRVSLDDFEQRVADMRQVFPDALPMP